MSSTRYLQLLGRDGQHDVMVGALTADAGLSSALQPDLLATARVGGSAIGGIAETQEMLDFCAAKGIYCRTSKSSPSRR